MKILISGGTGLVGKELGKKLTNKGHELFVLTREPNRSQIQTPYPHTPILWNAAKNSVPEEILHQIDGIINLAGVGVADKRWSENYKSKIFNSRVIGTQNLVRAANDFANNIKFFISTSAIGFYGEGEDLAEDKFPGNHFLSKVCAGWESPVENHLDEKIRKTIFRVGVVLSEKGGALSKMIPPIQMGIGGPLGHGQHHISWIDIDDLVNMYIYAIESNIDGTFNAVAPHPVTNMELTNQIAQIFQKTATKAVPRFALKMAVGEMATILLMNQKVSSSKIEKAGFNFQFPEIPQSLNQRVSPLAPTEKRVIFEQWVKKKKEEVFPFFSDAKNLEKITPPWVNFKILAQSTPSIELGTTFDYQIKLNGIPLKWRTLIDNWNPPHSFSDTQQKGPYKKWHHTHKFDDLAGGTLLTDQVDFILPGSYAGPLFLGWKVNEDIQNIFDHRQVAIYSQYNNPSESASSD